MLYCEPADNFDRVSSGAGLDRFVMGFVAMTRRVENEHHAPSILRPPCDEWSHRPAFCGQGAQVKINSDVWVEYATKVRNNTGCMENFMMILLAILVLVALWKANRAEENARRAAERLQELEETVARIERVMLETQGQEAAQIPLSEEVRLVPVTTGPVVQTPERVTPPPLPEWSARAVPTYQPPVPPPMPRKAKPPVSIEQFMGVKMFAWLGGVAMFFGVIFFVKYAFENNLIPPAVRIALGFVCGVGLMTGGLAVHRMKAYQVLAQAFCATGVLILYGVSYAARAVYHLGTFGPGTTFGLMALVTVAAFLMAVRMNALVVAVLGMLGGFLTPVLVSTGEDRPFGLFGYIALLVVGLLAVSRYRNWGFLTALAALGTVLMQFGWALSFFLPGHYAEGAKTWVPMGLLCFFIALFMVSAWLERSRGEWYAMGSALGLCAVALLFAFVMLAFPTVSDRSCLLYGFVLLVNLAVLGLALVRPGFSLAPVVTASVTFLHLAIWTMCYLKPGRLSASLVIVLIFGTLHSVAPVLLSRRMQARNRVFPLKSAPWFAPLTLVLLLLPVMHLANGPFLVWPAILVMDVLVILLAVSTGSMLPVLVSLLMTMGIAGVWLLHGPAHIESLGPFLLVIVVFAAVFAVAGRWLSGKPDADVPQSLTSSLLPVISGILPFVLLMMSVVRLPVANPTPVFGVGLLLVLLLLGLSVAGRRNLLALAALVCVSTLEAIWHGARFDANHAMIPLAWYLGFYLLFLLFPFVFHACKTQSSPWAASALAGVAHFLLIHDMARRVFPGSHVMGLLPAAFALPSMTALAVVLRGKPETERDKRFQTSWFGGVALLFITLIFPVQFDHQWLTVGWALEGAALIWLFRRVPHIGLQMTGLALLTLSFVRFALNPVVFVSYPRSGTAILNWHLYAYGLAAAAQIAGARLLGEPAPERAYVSLRPVLYSFGGVLLFLLLNIEIADFFTKPGERFIAFALGGNFARAMTYSIAWGLFSLGLLGIGIWCRAKPARLAAIALLAVTLLKLFVYDLSTIGSVYRIGALTGVAVIAFIASFLYQRFFERPDPS